MKEQPSENIPSWIGKQPVPEDKETTIELLTAWAKLLKVEMPLLLTDISEDKFLVNSAVVANSFAVIQKSKESPEPKENVAVWVGHQETAIGRLNAQLAVVIWNLGEEMKEASAAAALQKPVKKEVEQDFADQKDYIYARLVNDSGISKVLHIYSISQKKTLCSKPAITYSREIPSEGTRGCKICLNVMEKDRRVPLLFKIKENTMNVQ